MVGVYILIAEDSFARPVSAPPTRSTRGGFVCAAVPPLDNGGPGLLTMAPTSEPTNYTVALWDRFPETETRVFWLFSSFLNVGEGWERNWGGGRQGGGTQVSLRDGAKEISPWLPKCLCAVYAIHPEQRRDGIYQIWACQAKNTEQFPHVKLQEANWKRLDSWTRFKSPRHNKIATITDKMGMWEY